MKQFGTPHTDFGHSVKTFWLISLIGELADDYEMFTAAQRRAAQILDWAYMNELDLGDVPLINGVGSITTKMVSLVVFLRTRPSRRSFGNK